MGKPSDTKKYEGYVKMPSITFEVDSDASALEIEQAFNDAIDEHINSGFGGPDDWGYEPIDDEEDD